MVWERYLLRADETLLDPDWQGPDFPWFAGRQHSLFLGPPVLYLLPAEELGPPARPKGMYQLPVGLWEKRTFFEPWQSWSASLAGPGLRSCGEQPAQFSTPTEGPHSEL